MQTPTQDVWRDIRKPQKLPLLNRYPVQPVRWHWSQRHLSFDLPFAKQSVADLSVLVFLGMMRRPWLHTCNSCRASNVVARTLGALEIAPAYTNAAAAAGATAGDAEGALSLAPLESTAVPHDELFEKHDLLSQQV